MRYLFLTLLFFYFTFVNAQNYELIDKKVKNYPNFTYIEQLLIRVNNDFSNNEDKVRAFYTWIATNITYDLNQYYAFSPSKLKITFDSEYLNKSVTNQKNNKITHRTFNQRKAMCNGFSLLFNELCLKSGIDCQVIKGITKLSVNEMENSRNVKNHAWNAVKIDNKWKLIDVTWSSGYENINTGIWVQEFNDFYFFTTPEIFLATHYPENKKFQLVNTTLDLKSFFETPVFYTKYFDSGLKISKQQKGTITVSDFNKEIQLKFKAKKDTSRIYYTFKSIKQIKKMHFKKDGMGNYIATLKYNSNTSNILSLYCENEIILDFKIKKQL